MAIIQDLPQELLYRILELVGVGERNTDNRYRQWYSERAHLLKTTSLVARDWTSPSQDLLGRVLFLYKPGTVSHLARCTEQGSISRLQDLILSRPAIDSFDEARALLSSLTSLRSFQLSGEAASTILSPDLLGRGSDPLLWPTS